MRGRGFKMKIDESELKKGFDDLPDRTPSDFDSAIEAKHLKSLIENELDEFLKGYSSARAEGAGGSGVVISAVFDEFGSRRAIKLPRKRIFDSGANQPAAAVDPEIHALSK